ARSPAGIGVVPGGDGSGEAEKPPATAIGPANAGRPPEVQIDTAGAPISSSRPMPVTIVEGQKGGAWDQLLRSIETYLGLPRGILGGQGGPGGAGTGGGQPRSKVSPEQTNLINQTIDQYAASWHIDPAQFKMMVGAESGYDVMAAGDDNSSFGLGQFHFGNISSRFPHPGMGDAFLRDTGIDLRIEDNRRKYWREALWYAARRIHEKGYGDWSTMSGVDVSRTGPLLGTPTMPAYSTLEQEKVWGQPPTSGGGSGWNAAIGDIPPDLLARVKAENPDLSPRQCVQLAQAVMGVGNVHSWFRGAGEKDLPEEVALATFGFHGESDRYALGGSGTPGINRDHSLIRVKKYPDGSFDAISQDASHPPHLVHIPWTGKGGEGDASSYYGISHAARVSQALPPTGARLAMRQPRPVVHRNLAIASIRVETHAHDAHAIAADVRLAVEREMKSVA